MIDHCYDVVIVGAGGAGLRAAFGLGNINQLSVDHPPEKLLLNFILQLSVLQLSATSILIWSTDSPSLSFIPPLLPLPKYYNSKILKINPRVQLVPSFF